MRIIGKQIFHHLFIKTPCLYINLQFFKEPHKHFYLILSRLYIVFILSAITSCISWSIVTFP